MFFVIVRSILAYGLMGVGLIIMGFIALIAGYDAVHTHENPWDRLSDSGKYNRLKIRAQMMLSGLVALAIIFLGIWMKP